MSIAETCCEKISFVIKTSWQFLSITSEAKVVPKPDGIDVVSSVRILGSFMVERHLTHEFVIFSTMEGSAVVKKYLEMNFVS